MEIKFLNNAKKAIKKFLKSIYYSYAGFAVYDFIQRLSGYKKERQRIFKSIGYMPNLRNPQSFNEKVLWKKIHDRNPLLPIISDKYKVRDYLKEVLGEKEAEKILIPLFYVTDEPETIPFDNLGEEYVIKPNHASGLFILAENIEGKKRYTIVHNDNRIVLSDCDRSRKEIVHTCKDWLSMTYGFYQLEWAYQKIKRKIIIEKLLRDADGEPPANYYFTVIHGECRMVAIFYKRHDDKRVERYTSEQEYVNFKNRKNPAGYRKKSDNPAPELELVKILGKPFDYVRVDLYLLNDRIFFSELTNYPASGGLPFHQVSDDFELGSKWKLTGNYWK